MTNWLWITCAATMLGAPMAVRAAEPPPNTQAEDGLMSKHPAAYYQLAASLMGAGRQDEAVFWFYAGQLRYRIHLSCIDAAMQQDEAPLFAALSESIGRPINEYAFGDPPALAATLQKVLDWDGETANGFTSTVDCAAAVAQNRKGLADLRQSVVDGAETIRAERAKNGLPNR